MLEVDTMSMKEKWTSSSISIRYCGSKKRELDNYVRIG